MKQAYLADAVPAIPASTGAASVGNPSDGDPANNVEATALGAYAMYQMFTELENVIADGGLTADVDTLTQVRDAIREMIDSDIAALNFPTAVQLATDNEHLQTTPPGDEAATPRGVRAVRDALIGGAPGGRDTLDELYDVLNVAKAALASPTFTGSPKAPTPPANNDSTRLATTAWVLSAIAAISGVDLSAYATLANPVFTGNPRSVTPPSGDDDTSIATTAWVRANGTNLATRNEHLSNNPPTNEAAVPAYVMDMIEVAVSDLMDSSPGALDTLNELAAALGDDANFSATVTNALALKANIAGPTFTGTVRAPTPSVGDDSTRIATTAWLQGFFGTASRRAFTTAGAHSYDWEWGTPNGIAFIVGGGGGGGGGGGSGGGVSTLTAGSTSEEGAGGAGGSGAVDGGAGFEVRTGSGGGDGGGWSPAEGGEGGAPAVLFSSATLSSSDWGGSGGGGGKGFDGGESSANVGGDIYSAAAGEGGIGGGGGAGSRNASITVPAGIQIGTKGPQGDTARGGGPGGGEGGEGGVQDDTILDGGRGGNGGNGNAGTIMVQLLNGLSKNDTIAVMVGAGGAPGNGGGVGERPLGTTTGTAGGTGSSGDAGQVILIPLF